MRIGHTFAHSCVRYAHASVSVGSRIAAEHEGVFTCPLRDQHSGRWVGDLGRLLLDRQPFRDVARHVMRRILSLEHLEKSSMVLPRRHSQRVVLRLPKVLKKSAPLQMSSRFDNRVSIYYSPRPLRSCLLVPVTSGISQHAAR